MSVKEGTTVWIVALAALVVAACASGERRPADTLASQKALARRVFDEVLNKGDFRAFGEIYSPDFVKNPNGAHRTLAQEIQDARSTRAGSSDLVMTIDDMIAEGDRVAVLYTGRGTHDGPVGGVPPTGRRFNLSGVTVFRFSGGKIVEETTIYNELEFLRQIGVMPGRKGS